MIFELDLAGAEWRCCAFVTQDARMIQELIDGFDPHSYWCTEWLKLPLNKDNRFITKNAFTFRMLYTDEENLGYPFYIDPRLPRFSKKTWDSIVREFYERYNGFAKTHVRWYKEVCDSGGILRSVTGRKYVFKKIRRKGLQVFNKSQVYNYPVQGLSGGEVLPLLMVQINQDVHKQGLRAYIIDQVHDSVEYDIHKQDIDKLLEICYNRVKGLPLSLSKLFNIDWNVPLGAEVKVGPNWGKLQEIAKI